MAVARRLHCRINYGNKSKEEVDGLHGKKEEVLLLVVKIKRRPRGGCRRKTYC